MSQEYVNCSYVYFSVGTLLFYFSYSPTQENVADICHIWYYIYPTPEQCQQKMKKNILML